MKSNEVEVKKEGHRTTYTSTSDTGTSRVTINEKTGKVTNDMYWGNVEDPYDHDRYITPLNDGVGKPSGHGFNREK